MDFAMFKHIQSQRFYLFLRIFAGQIRQERLNFFTNIERKVVQWASVSLEILSQLLIKIILS